MRVNAIEWLAPETKAEALKKVSTIQVGVGYPESWRDFSSVAIPKGNPYAAVQAAGQAEYAHQLAKIGKPLDTHEWWMTPQTVTRSICRCRTRSISRPRSSSARSSISRPIQPSITARSAR